MEEMLWGRSDARDRVFEGRDLLWYIDSGTKMKSDLVGVFPGVVFRYRIINWKIRYNRSKHSE